SSVLSTRHLLARRRSGRTKHLHRQSLCTSHHGLHRLTQLAKQNPLFYRLNSLAPFLSDATLAEPPPMPREKSFSLSRPIPGQCLLCAGHGLISTNLQI